MGFAQAHRSDKEQASAGRVDGVLFHERSGGEKRPAERRVSSFEVSGITFRVGVGGVGIKRTMAIAFRNMGGREASSEALELLALAGTRDPTALRRHDPDQPYPTANLASTHGLIQA